MYWGSIAFIVLPLLLSPRPPEELGFLARPIIRDFTGNFLMLLVFYLNYYLLIPVFYFRKRYVVYTIYSLAKDDSAPDAIVKLSELMRYILRDSNKPMVLLEKELNYINNYIALQQSRLGRTVSINYEYEVDVWPANKMIRPLIMISFIENAFKHGVNPDKMAEITIWLALKENILHLYVNNQKVTNDPVDGEGIGLENTRKRLQLLYPSRH